MEHNSHPNVSATVLVIRADLPMKMQLLYASLAVAGSGLNLIGEFLADHTSHFHCLWASICIIPIPYTSFEDVKKKYSGI